MQTELIFASFCFQQEFSRPCVCPVHFIILLIHTVHLTRLITGIVVFSHFGKYAYLLSGNKLDEKKNLHHSRACVLNVKLQPLAKKLSAKTGNM